MKILLISNNFTRRMGDERYIIEMAQCFVKEHEVHLLTSISDLSLNEYSKISKLIIHKKKNIRNPYWLQMLVNAFLNARYAKTLKSKFELDIIHSNTWESFFSDVIVLHSCYRAWLNIANQTLKKKSFYPKYLLYKIRRELLPKNRVFLTVEKNVLEKGSKKIIVGSQWLKSAILANYKVPEEKIVVIPFGVDLDKFRPNLQKRLEVRKKYNIGKDDVCLMFSGGYEFERKGLEYIIKALPLLRGKVKILAVGKENSRRYRELAASLGVLDEIIFTGFVPEIKDYYPASDIYIFPTTYEPFGITTLEAMATGLPVIISKLAGSAETIKDGVEGLLLNDPTDSEEIAEKINLLLNNKNLRKQMGENAYKTAQKYSWAKVAEKTLEVYKEVLRAEK